MVVGTATNLMTGKGRFQVNYLGTILTGGARVSPMENRAAWQTPTAPRGMYMSCDYPMNTPYQGACTCTFSNGAKYQMHLSGNQRARPAASVQRKKLPEPNSPTRPTMIR